MKKSYLAAAAILGAAVFAGEAHAVKLKYGDGKSFKMGFRAKINATYKGKRDSNDKADLVMSVPNARIYAKGSISKVFKWGFQAEMGGTGKWYYDKKGNPTPTPEIIDAYVMLDFAKEFKIAAGSIKIPFELHSGIQSGWSLLAPTGLSGLGGANPFKNPAETTVPRSGSRSPQITLWGKVADGLVKYYAGITDADDDDNNKNTQTGYYARVEFSPVMAGYKGHPGYVLKESYLGKQDTLALGLSYFTQKIGGETATSFGADLLWEQNLGAVTPNVSLGYVDHKNWKGTKNADGRGFIAQGQVLINQKTILGKPAIGVRYAQADPDGLKGKNKKSSVIGVVAQLYVKGVGNRIALSVDRATDDNKSKDKSYTDVNLAFWYSF